MGVTRRNFLKISGGAAVATTATGLTAQEAQANERENRLKGAKVTTSICPYCAVGCGMLAYEKKGKIIAVEGDPDHPVNQGTLCSKRRSVYQIANNDKRLLKPKYRAPGSDKWQEVEWDWTLDRIAQKIKDTRDKYFTTHNAKGQEVNRTEAIASVGSAALDNEECYIYQKWLRSLGLVYIEHQARI